MFRYSIKTQINNVMTGVRVAYGHIFNIYSISRVLEYFSFIHITKQMVIMVDNENNYLS
jgi:hypothetical protein